MPEISTFGMAVNFTASTNQTAVTAMMAPDPLGGDPTVNTLFPVGTAFKPTLGEGMVYHQNNLEWSWNKDFVVNYKALMRNRLNRVMQMLQQALEESLRRSMTGTVDDGTLDNAKSAGTNPSGQTGWKTATAAGGAMQQFESLRTMAVIQKAVPVVKGNILGLDLGATIPAANYDPVTGGLGHRSVPKGSLTEAIMGMPPPGGLSGTVTAAAQLMINGKWVDANGRQTFDGPAIFSPSRGDPPTNDVLKVLDYEVGDNDVGQLIETKIGTGAFWSTTNYLKQFRLNPEYSFMTRYTTESRNWYKSSVPLLGGLLDGGGPALFLRRMPALALRGKLGSWTMDYSTVPDIAPNVVGVPIAAILATAANYQTLDIAGAMIPNPSAMIGFPLNFDSWSSIPVLGTLLAPLLTLLSGAFSTGLYFGSDKSVYDRLNKDPSGGFGIGGLDPYLGPNHTSLGSYWWTGSDPMNHPSSDANPEISSPSSGSVGFIDDGNRSVYKNNLVIETATNIGGDTPAIAAARAALATATANVNAALPAYNAAKDAQTAAQQKVDALQAQIQAAQDQVNSAQKAVDNATNDLNQANQQLTDANNMVTKAKADLDQAKADLTAAQTNYNNVKATYDAQMPGLKADAAAKKTAADNAEQAYKDALTLKSEKCDQGTTWNPPGDPNGVQLTGPGSTACSLATADIAPKEQAMINAKKAASTAQSKVDDLQNQMDLATSNLGEPNSPGSPGYPGDPNSNPPIPPTPATPPGPTGAYKKVADAQAAYDAAVANQPQAIANATTAVNNATTALNQAKTNLAAAQTNLTNVQNAVGPQLAAAQAELNQANADLAAAKATLDAAQAAQAQAQANLAAAIAAAPSRKQPYDLWGTVDESKGLPPGIKLDFKKTTTDPIAVNPDMLSNLNDGSATQEDFGSPAQRKTSYTNVDGTTVQTYLPVYGARIHQQDGTEDTTERLKNLASQSYGIKYTAVDPKTGAVKEYQITPGAFTNGTDPVEANVPTGGLDDIKKITLDDDINKYLRFQDRENARSTARLNPTFGNLPLGTWKGNDASTNYSNPFIDTLAKVISDPTNAGIFMLGMARDLYVTASTSAPLGDMLASSIRLDFRQTGTPTAPGTNASAVDLLQNEANWQVNPNEAPSFANNNALHPVLGLVTTQERYVSFQSQR